MAILLYKLSSRMLVSFGLLLVLTLAAIGLVYLYGIPFTNYGGEFDEHRTAVFKQLNLVADLKAERLKRWFEERMDDTKVIAESSMLKDALKEIAGLLRENAALGLEGEALRDEVMKSGPYNSLVRHLSLVKNTYAIYQEIHISDAASKTITISTDTRDVGTAVHWREGVLNTLMTGDFVIDFPHVHTLGQHEDIISIYYPITDIGAPAQGGADSLYVLTMHVATDDLIMPLLHAGKGLGMTGEVLLVNQEVKIITPLRHPLPDGSVAEPLKYRIDAKPAIFAARGEEGLIEEDDYRGVPVLAAYRHIRLTSEMGMGMVVKRDTSEVFAPLRRNIVYTTAAGLGVLLLSLFVAYMLSRNIARPVRSVHRAARDIQSGHLEARADVFTDDEVGSVATAFNSMAEQIERWHGELEGKVKARTEELNKANQELSSTVGELERVNKAFVGRELKMVELKKEIKELKDR